MLVADAPQPRLMERLVLVPVERRVFLDQLVERGGQADIVLSVTRRDGQHIIARGPLDVGRGGRLARTPPLAGADFLSLADGDTSSGLGLAALPRLSALHPPQPPTP